MKLHFTHHVKYFTLTASKVSFALYGRDTSCNYGTLESHAGSNSYILVRKYLFWMTIKLINNA